MNCINCEGNLVNRISNFIPDLEDSIVIVRDVPSQVCTDCGKVSYSHEVAKKLEMIVNRALMGHLQECTVASNVD